MSQEILNLLKKKVLKKKLTKSEQKLRDDLVKWHKNSDKRNFFIGEKRDQDND